uniref:Conserved domain protein n=1 Tax=Schistosoma mansoni TaxID=6183 RepID=A0A5K4F990_SCHMA
MTNEKYHSDFEMDSETDDSDNNSIDHADFYQPKNREPVENTEVKLTLMEKARRRPGVFIFIVLGFAVLITALILLAWIIFKTYFK